MKREFFINIILLFLINFLVKPLYIFGVDAHIQNLTGTQAYGSYFFYLNFVFLFQFVNDPGLQNWNAQYIPKNRNSIKNHLGSIIQIKLLFSFIFSLVVVVATFLLGFADQKMAFFISISLALTSLYMVLRGAIAGMGYYRADSLFSALDKVFMIFILGYLSWISDLKSGFNIIYLVYGQGAATLLACMVAFIFLVNRTGIIFTPVNFAFMMSVLRQSAPYVLILLFMTAYNKLDGVMLGAMLQDHNYQAGVYASAYRFYDAANMMGYLFAALLLPMYAAHTGVPSVLNELKSSGLKLTAGLAAGIVCITIFYGEPLLKAVYTEYTSEFYGSLKLLMMGYFMVAVAYIFGTMLVAAGKVGELNKLFAVGLLVNICLNLALIPSYKSEGAALATLVTQVFVMVGQVYLCRRELSVGITMDEAVNIIVFALVMAMVFGASKFMELFNWETNLAVCVLISVLLSFVFRIVSLREIKSLFAGSR